MDRYLDNTSPEPTTSQIQQNCYKTPEVSQFQALTYSSNYQYPTPPSDNEDSTVAYQHSKQTDVSPSSYYNSQQTSSSSSNSSPDNSHPTSISSTSRYKRRSRTTFSKSQLDILEQTFQKAQYPEIKVVDDLSTMLNLSTERISIWFQNRRARFKKARKLHSQENTSYINETSSVNKPYVKYTPGGYEMTPTQFHSSFYASNQSDLVKSTLQPLHYNQMLIPSSQHQHHTYSTFYPNQSIDSNYYYQNTYAANMTNPISTTTNSSNYMYQC